MSPIAREIVLVYALTVAVTIAVTYTPSALLADFGHLILAASFLFLALHHARKHGGAQRFGIDLAGVLEASPDEDLQGGLFRTLLRALPRVGSELGFALLVCAVVFPPFVLAFKLWHGVSHPFTFQPPRQPWDFMLGQLVVVALPEEALFRGYFQTRLSELFPRTSRVLRAEVSLPALVCQAALFALLHFLVGFSPSRLAVFFPGLVFGWLRALRGGIGAAIWFHAFSNLLSEILTRGYL